MEIVPCNAQYKKNNEITTMNLRKLNDKNKIMNKFYRK